MGTVKYSGPVASFHCPTEATIRSLKVHFSPKQLGSGTPSPENVREIEGWDGVKVRHCGKNLYDKSKLHINSEYDWNFIATGVKQKGNTGNNFPRRTFIDIAIPNATYYWTESCYEIGFLDKDENVLVYYSGWTIRPRTAPADAAYVYHTWLANTSMTAEEVDIKNDSMDLYYELSSFETYRGETIDYEFGLLGKNKFNPNCDMLTSSGIYSISNGVITQTGSDGRGWTSDTQFPPIELKAGTYTISSSDNCTINLATSINGYQTITRFQHTSGTFTLAEDASIKFKCSDSEYPLEHTIQIELGSTATAYEPYDPNKTVYGGWVDLISGEVQQEYDKIVLDGSFNPGIFPWAADTEDENDTIITHALYLKRDTYDNKHKRDAGAYCDQLQWYNINNVRNKIGFGMYDGSSYSACLMLPKELVGDTNETLNSYLSANPITIVSELETPITYHLPPNSSELKTFLSQNNIWSNADYVEVEYDLHETQSILARKQFIVANQPHIVKPAAAPLQNFVTDMVAPLKECKVYFEPKQDLNGYSKPWVGGSGKNLFNSATSTPKKYIGSDGNIYTSDDWSASDYIAVTPSETYTISGADAPGGTGCHAFYDSNKGFVSSVTGYDHMTFTVPEEATYVRFSVRTETPTTVQLEKGSAATAYEPWENVCPIEGWTGIEVTQCGKNILNKEQYFNYPPTNKKFVNYTTGATKVWSNSYHASEFIPVVGGQQYILHSAFYAQGTAGIAFYDAKQQYIDGIQMNSNTIYEYSFITPSNAKYMRFSAIIDNSYDITINYDDMFIEIGASPTTYEPYNGMTLLIDWATEAGTIYGGYVNLVTGEVWETHHKLLLDGITSGCKCNSDYSNNTYIIGGIVYLVPTGGVDNGSAANSKLRFDRIGVTGSYEAITTIPTVQTITAGRQYLRFYVAYTADHPELDTKQKRIDFCNEFLSSNPITVVYPLQTPQLLTTLTPTQLKTLRGTNNIWSNSNGNVEIAYWKH